MRTRRSLLGRGAALAALGLAGCVSDGGSGTATDATATADPTGTRGNPSTTARPTYRPSTVSLSLDPASLDAVAERVVLARAELTERQRAALDEMRESGSYTLTGVIRHERLAFPNEPFVRYDGGVDRVTSTVVAERPVTAHRFHVETLSGTPPDAVAFDDLSALDRSVFRAGLTEEYVENGTPFAGTFRYVFDDADPENSRFVADGPVTVAYGDDAFRVAFQRTDRLTATDVRYTLSRVADSRAAFRDHLRSTYVEALPWSAFTPAERELVRQAIRGRYREERPLSAAFSSVLDALEALPSVPNAGTYVRHEGEMYHVERRAVEV